MRTWWPFGSMTLKALIPAPDGYPSNPETVGEHIKKVRMDRDLLQREVADIVGVTGRNVMNWETARDQPRFDHWPGVIRFLGYDPYGDPESFSEKMSAVMRRDGLSKTGLASVLGVSQRAVIVWGRSDGPRWPRMRREIEAKLDALLRVSARVV